MTWTWSKMTVPLILSSSVESGATASWSSGALPFSFLVFFFLCNSGCSDGSSAFVTLSSVIKMMGVPSRLGVLALSETGKSKGLAGLPTSSVRGAMSDLSMVWTRSTITVPLISFSSVGRGATSSWSSRVFPFGFFFFFLLCNSGSANGSSGFVTLSSATKVVGVPSRLGVFALSETGKSKGLSGLPTSSGTGVISVFSVIWIWSKMTAPLILSSSVGRGATASWSSGVLPFGFFDFFLLCNSGSSDGSSGFVSL
uniref:Putative secreted protein n=1 Tax=Ixodes ricinus TaxID=34613 RepID=A0A6B0V5C5_IXORI